MVAGTEMNADADPIGRRLAAFGEEFMTLFDDQPSAREVRNRQQAWSGEDAQHASSTSPGKASTNATTECSPSTPDQWAQDANELGFNSSKRVSGGQGSRSDSQKAKSTSKAKLKRMFLEGQTPEQTREAEARAQQQADLKLRRQDAVLHHDFDRMRREVETLGASMLGKKQKRDFDRTVLHQVKAKPMKGPGIPASLGLQLAKAKKQRQQAAKQEAIATGMHQLKAIGKGKKGGGGNGKVRQKKLKR